MRIMSPEQKEAPPTYKFIFDPTGLRQGENAAGRKGEDLPDRLFAPAQLSFDGEGELGVARHLFFSCQD